MINEWSTIIFCLTTLFIIVLTNSDDDDVDPPDKGLMVPLYQGVN